MERPHRAHRALLALLLGATALSPCFASGTGEGSDSAFIQTGHKGVVISMEYSPASGRLFTSGEDGTVRVWDLKQNSLMRVLRVGRRPVDMIALNGAQDELAVLETDGVGYFAVSAWNWVEGRMLFRLPLDQAPLFLRYSDSGGYLTLGIPTWDGFMILKSGDGTRFPFHPEGFGIISFAEISRSEKTIMTYQPSGRIAYWDLASGNLIKEVRTTASLSQARISADKRFLLGVVRTEVVLLDLVSGALKSRLPVTGRLSVDLSDSGTEAAIFSQDASTLQRWNLQSGAAAPGTAAAQPGTAAATPPIPAGLSIVRYAGDELLAAGATGQIYRLPAQGQPQLFSRDELADVSGIASSSDAVALASAQWIWIFPSSSALAGNIQPTVMPNPLQTASGIGFTADGGLAVWSKEGEKGAYALISTEGAVSPGAGVFANPLLQALILPDSLIGLERGGMIRGVDLATGRQLFSIWLPGTNRIALINNQIIAARSVTGMTEKSLASVNIKTGETVQLQSSAVFAFDLAYDALHGILYSLGVDASGVTGLYANSGRSLERQTRISSVPEADLAASITLDSGSGLLYTTLGFDGVKAWDGRLMTPVSDGEAVPRRVVAGAELLCSLNQDSTVSFSNRSGAPLGTLHLFLSGDWCLIFPGGRYAASDGGAAAVRVLSGGVEAPNPAAYRILP